MIQSNADLDEFAQTFLSSDQSTFICRANRPSITAKSVGQPLGCRTDSLTEAIWTETVRVPGFAHVPGSNIPVFAVSARSMQNGCDGRGPTQSDTRAKTPRHVRQKLRAQGRLEPGCIGLHCPTAPPRKSQACKACQEQGH